MFFGQNEKELFCGEFWSIWQNNKLPDHLQLLVDQELGKRDIWELQTQEPDNQPIHPSLNEDSSHSTKIGYSSHPFKGWEE
ncbi:MAG: hypothetical protein V7K27_33600 [Nostoc sp.]